jgi:hypothetical protein
MWYGSPSKFVLDNVESGILHLVALVRFYNFAGMKWLPDDERLAQFLVSSRNRTSGPTRFRGGFHMYVYGV